MDCIRVTEKASVSPILYIGDKNFSSQSLSAWLCLRWTSIRFEERRQFDRPDRERPRITGMRALPSDGTVPLLDAYGISLWDSLAIAEWAAEQAMPGLLWPRDPTLRALARATACEAHAGFASVHRDLPMNIGHRLGEQPEWSEETRIGLARIDRLWTHLREQHLHLGIYLFGRSCIADAFFTPMAARLRTYAVPLSPLSEAYRDILLNDSDFLTWEAAAGTDIDIDESTTR